MLSQSPVSTAAKTILTSTHGSFFFFLEFQVYIMYSSKGIPAAVIIVWVFSVLSVRDTIGASVDINEYCPIERPDGPGVEGLEGFEYWTLATGQMRNVNTEPTCPLHCECNIIQ